jgi:hypothetical protein
VLSDESKQAIDALSKDDLLLEVNKGHSSRFQGEKFAYLQSRLQRIQESENTAQHEAEIDVGVEANNIARDANATANKALRLSKLSIIVAVVAIIVAMWAKN